MKKRTTIWIVLLTILLACVEKFDDVTTAETDNRLVVESFISQADSFQVKLSRTRSFGSTSSFPKVSGATVVIEDNLGNISTLTETFSGSGTYSNTTTGVIGRSYQLRVTVNDTTFQSDFIEMLPVATIDTIINREVEDELDVGDDGYYAFVCTKDCVTTRDFYIWFYDTYKKGDNGSFDPSRVEVNFDVIDDRFFNGISTCDANPPKANINDEPFEAEDTFLVFQQFHVDEDAFDFWSQVLIQTQFVGGPFDVPPSPIIGNMRNVKNQNDFALGYFMVGGKDIDTVFVPDAVK